MDRRSLILLGGAAVASIGGALLLAPGGGEAPPGPGNGGPAAGDLVFPGLADRLAAARRIELGRPDATLSVARREDGVWVLPDMGDYPVRPARVRELLVGLTELRLVEPRTADPALLDRLGLEDPAKPGSTALPLRVLDAQGAALAELVVGRRRVRTQGNVPESVFLRRPAETQAWLAEGRLPVDADPQLWIERDIVNLPSARIARVAVARLGAPPILLARREAGEDARLALEAPVEAIAAPLDPVALDEVARAFEYLTFLEVRKDSETPGVPLGTATFGLDGGLAVTVQGVRAGDTLWIRLRAEGESEEARTLSARWAGWAYQVGTWKEKAFLPRMEDLAARPAAAPAEAPAPAQQ